VQVADLKGDAAPEGKKGKKGKGGKKKDARPFCFLPQEEGREGGGRKVGHLLLKKRGKRRGRGEEPPHFPKLIKEGKKKQRAK